MTEEFMKAMKKLASLMRARFPYVYITTWEEERAVNMIKKMAKLPQLIKTPREVYTWTQTKGFVKEKDGSTKAGTSAPLKAIEFIESSDEDAIFIFKDFHTNFGIKNRPADYNTIRRLRDILPNLKSSAAKKNVIFISPELVIPDTMEKEISIFDFKLPSLEEIKARLDMMISQNSESLKTSLTEEDKIKLCKGALGLTLQEAENAFALAMVNDGRIDIKDLSVVLDEKMQVIKKTGILEFVQSNLGIDDIGGLGNLKNWLLKRNNSWSETAKIYNIPAPKGVLITGVPGCGKSLTAKAMSAIWQLPLLRLDLGKIFSGIVGSSEENMRRAIATAEAVAPSILWVDEIEKGLAGVGSGSNGDSGTSARIFGTFLTWMQEKTAPVFVIATANNIHNLPPELLRKGRFDEIFFVDLPTVKERYEIFKLHLNKRLTNQQICAQITIDDNLLSKLATTTEGFVGSEIENVVVSALYEAFFANRGLLEEDLMNIVKNTVPLSVTQKEQILSLREWANVRAISATNKEDLQEYQQQQNTEDKTADISKSRGGRTLDF